jgi:hypothetical protein
MSELLKLMKERYHKGYLTYHRKFWKEILNHTEDLERKLEEAREELLNYKVKYNNQCSEMNRLKQSRKDQLSMIRKLKEQNK